MCVGEWLQPHSLARKGFDLTGTVATDQSTTAAPRTLKRPKPSHRLATPIHNTQTVPESGYLRDSQHIVGDHPIGLVDRAPFAAPPRDTLSRDTASDTEAVVHRREGALVSSF